LVEVISTLRLSPGKERIANLPLRHGQFHLDGKLRYAWRTHGIRGSTSRN
jgi:hypothetical protein